MDGFIDDDLAGESWRMELQQITGYDPKKCALIFVPNGTCSCCEHFPAACTHSPFIITLRTWVNLKSGLYLY